MNKLKYILLLFLFPGFIHLQAQTEKPLSIRMDLKEGILVINHVRLNIKSTRNDYYKALGPPERIEQTLGKDKFLIYDKLGISLALQNGTEVVQSFRITYQPGHDKNFATGKYPGGLAVNDTPVSDKTDYPAFEKIAGVPFASLGKGHYIAKTSSMYLAINYNQEILTDIGIQFNDGKE